MMPQEQVVDPRALMRALRRRALLAIAVFAVVVGVVVGATVTQTPVYQAEVALLVNKEQPKGGALSDIPALQEMVEFGPRAVETQARLMSSPELFHQAAESLGLDPKALPSTITWNVQNPKDTDMLLLQVQDENPERAAQLAQAAAEQHLENMQSGSQNVARRAIEFITDQLEYTRAELDDLEETIRAYKKSHGIVDLSTEAAARAASASDLGKSAASARAEAAGAGSRVGQLRAELASQEEKVVSSSTISRNPLVAQIESEITTLEIQFAQESALRMEEHPNVVALQERITEAKARLTDAVETVLSSEVETSNPIHQSLAESLAMAEADSRAASARSGALSSAAAAEEGRLAAIPDLERDLATLERDKTVTSQMYALLLEKQQELQIQEAMTPPIVEIITAAQAPKAPIKPRKALNFAIALVLGLILAALAVGAAEMVDDSIRTSWQAQDELGLPSLGIVPRVREGRQLLTGPSPSPAMLDAFATVRSNLRVATAGGMPRMVLITSPEEGDGKTLTAVNLAAMLADGGDRVLLLGADMRNPDLHKALGVNATPGLSDVLTRTSDLRSALQTTQRPNLVAMTAGSLAPNPLALIDSTEMRATLDQLKGQFDVILIDAPDTAQYAEAPLLAAACDAVLPVLRIGRSSMRAAQGMLAKLDRAGKPILGSIPNGIKRKAKDL